MKEISVILVQACVPDVATSDQQRLKMPSFLLFQSNGSSSASFVDSTL